MIPVQQTGTASLANWLRLTKFLTEELQETVSELIVQAVDFTPAFSSNTLLVLPECQKLF